MEPRSQSFQQVWGLSEFLGPSTLISDSCSFSFLRRGSCVGLLGLFLSSCEMLLLEISRSSRGM